MTGDWELRCIAYTGNNMKADFDLHENDTSGPGFCTISGIDLKKQQQLKI